MDVPVNPRGTVDVHINDFIRLTVNLKKLDNTAHLEGAPLLRLMVVLREVSPFEPLL
jgi:hypothetical protein